MGEHVAGAVFWNPPMPALCHIPQTPSSTPAYACLLGFSQKLPCSFPSRSPLFFFFFLFLEDPETEVDGTRMGHGLKQRKEKEDETEMPTRPAHVGARHDTRCTQVGTATLLPFV